MNSPYNQPYKQLHKLPAYLQLIRFDKPIGWILLLCPTLWALWVASDGSPNAKLVWIFSIAVVVMRSLGCVINDLADQKFDGKVERTKGRPLVSGQLTQQEAIVAFVVLGLVALVLLFLLPTAVWPWAIPAAAVTIAYPFMKRFFVMPQLVLGIAFSFSIPMVYVAVQHPFDLTFWLLVLANFCWIVAYDTEYAISDREDDLAIGVKSTAIFFGKYDRIIIALLQFSVLALFVVISKLESLSNTFYLSLLLVAALFAYQQWLIRDYDRDACFKAFLNNAWVGATLCFGIIV